MNWGEFKAKAAAAGMRDELPVYIIDVQQADEGLRVEVYEQDDHGPARARIEGKSKP